MNFKPLLTGKEISDLLFSAPAVEASGGARQQRQGRSGGRVSAVKGSGMDFADLRAYQPGDDPRAIDWRATARSNHPLVRTFNTDLGNPVYLLIDRRASMRFGTRHRLKVTQAVRAALWLGGREARAGHEIAGVILDLPCQWLPRQQGMTGIRQLAEMATRPCPPLEPDQHEPDWRKILAGLQQRLPRDSTLLMFSDFIGLGAASIGQLRHLGQHCETVAVQICDPLELLNRLPGAMQYHWGPQVLRLQRTAGKQAEWIARQQQQRADFLDTEFTRAGILLQQLRSDVDELSEVLQ